MSGIPRTFGPRPSWLWLVALFLVASCVVPARLNAMNVRFKTRLPWALAFPFARAIQQPALEIWRGEAANVPAAQQPLCHRANCNRAARRGEYSAAMENA
jgi:fructose-bisphosphate aldolase class I